MSQVFKTIVRLQSGKNSTYEITNVDSVEQARAFVLQELPGAKVVMILAPKVEAKLEKVYA